MLRRALLLIFIMNEKDWFKLKKYPHIGLPIEGIMRHKWIESYVTDPLMIKKHSFLPFIHRVSKKRRYRKKYDDYGEKVSNTQNEIIKDRFAESKPRELFYASHIDSLIYSYYTKLLTAPYEKKLQLFGLNHVVTAYRAIPKDSSVLNGSNKCNVDFANDIFNIIREFPDKKFSVITFDIKSFFDNLDHNLLRKVWLEVMDCEKLPDDHFSVFKNITRFSYVDIQDIFEEYRNEIITQKKNRSGVKLQEKKKKVSKIKFLKSQNAKAFCLKKDFIKNSKKLIKSNKLKKDENDVLQIRNFGIPQGSPISSILANIYLLHFDKTINEFVESNNGHYRRYSDDMIVVCPLDKSDEIEQLFYNTIKNFKLEIQPQKTQNFVFERRLDKLNCGQKFGSIINYDKNLIYLGFEFDGEKVLLKSASLAGFYRKMKKSIRRAKYYSLRHKKDIFYRRLYKRFTFRGARKYKISKWDSQQQKFVVTEQQNWGNFLSYAKKASNVMDKNGIKKQIKNHWKLFHRELER